MVLRIGKALGLIVLGFMLYRSYQSYLHFGWVNVSTPQGMVAIPAWHK
jgi:hypothetical protein